MEEGRRRKRGRGRKKESGCQGLRGEAGNEESFNGSFSVLQDETILQIVCRIV